MISNYHNNKAKLTNHKLVDMKAIHHLKSVQPLFRSVLFLLAFLLCSSIASADVLNVKSLTHDPLDLTGAVNSKADFSGNACALLKIVLPKEAANVIFEGNTIDIQNDGVEVYVYLTQGSKYLTIKSAGFEPLQIYFPDYGISALEGKQTYKVEIAKMKTLSQVKRSANGTALAYSIIPGLGLIQKGRTGEGVGYLISDVALIGGGIGLNVYGNQQKKKMNDINSTIDQYRKAKNNYDSAKTGSYICYGAAIGVYVLNLVRSYVASPKPNAPLKWSIAAESLPSSIGSRNNLAFNVSLCYTF